MSRLLIVLFALAALASAVDPPSPRLIDFNPWSWLPSSRNKSPFIMDYFFPPSRTPKQSNLDPPADRQPPTVQTTMDDAMTTINGRQTTLSRRIHNKIKTTVPAPRPTATVPPKTKKSHKTTPTDTTTQSKTTQSPKLEITTTKVPVTSRPTKHYSIKPVRTTETTQDTASTMNTNMDSTETVGLETLGTTSDIVKDTGVPTTSTAEGHSTEASTTTDSTTIQDSTTTEPADSREGYLPLRDKPQQTQVKINEETKKEVSSFNN
ncbi:unnamed protein product [Leptidea sinapis]|uniref:Uncharacterized protein n=1 Tax=Leptidea sinapis TaxID=189913 RepID=A0A5E4PTA5_9NEOP|nr:unnamed protein product [Leptidea sinapis]